MFFRVAVLVVFFSNILTGVAQSPKIDSLQQALKVVKSDSAKSKIYGHLFESLLFSDKDKALIALDSLKYTAKQSQHPFSKYNYYSNNAFYFFIASKADSALANLEYALPFAENMNDPEALASLHDKISTVYGLRKSDSEKTIYHAEKALEIAQKNNLFEVEMQALLSLGIIYYQKEEHYKALDYFLQVEKQGKGINSPATINSAISVANVYNNLEEYKKARQYYELAQKRAEAIEERNQFYFAQLNLAEIDAKQNLLNEAEDKIRPVIEFYENTNSKYPLSESYIILGEIYRKRKNFIEAIDWYLKSVNEKRIIEDFTGITQPLLQLGKIYFENNQLSLAKTQLNELLKISNNVDTKLIFKSEALSLLSKINNKQGNYKDALQQLQQHQSLKDSIASKRKAKELKELDIKYQTELKEAEIAKLQAESALEEQKSVRNKTLYLSGILLFLLLSAFLWFQNRNRKKRNDQLRLLDKEKTAFYTNMSHELRTPLTLIQGPINDLLDTSKNVETQQPLQLIKTNASRMLEMVEQMTDLSRMSSGHLKFKPTTVALKGVISDLVNAYSYKAETKNLKFETSISVENTVEADVDIIQKIISNLLENAIKYTDANGVIDAQFKTSPTSLSIDVSNTNTEITTNELSKLLQRFKQKDINTQGMGVGLSIVQALTKLHGGTLHFYKKDDKVCFSIEIPITVSNTSSITTTEHINHLEVADDTADTQQSSKQRILIVEDQDDILNYVVSIFKDEYNVFTAKDGEEGIAIAKAEQPDIIVSDIMMPKVSGISLCNTLKADIITSHIPIILLTAKATQDDQIEGLKHGAEAYVTKPFKSSILKEQVNTLLNQRALLKERFSQSLYLKPVEVAMPNGDTIFLERIQEVFDLHLTDSNFNAEQFAKVIGMSRMQLHRKLKSMFGISTSEFIRTQRLQTSLELLKNESLTISEIAYSCGFSSPSMYSKHFKDAFGCSPTAYNH